MDVFGTVVSAIDLAGKLINYVKAVKGGKQDRLELLSEVSALKTLLEVMSGRLDNTDAGGNGDISNSLVKAGIKGPLNACYGALKSTVDGLERVVQNHVGKTSPFGGIIRDLKWPFRQEDINTTLGNIERLKSLIMLALQTSLVGFIEKARDELAIVGTNMEDLKSIVSTLETDQRAHTKKVEGTLKDLGAKLQHATDGMVAITANAAATIDRNQQGKERRGVLKWLSAPVFDQKHSSAFGKHAAGTGEWFFQHPKFVAWRRGEYNVLWCPGNPGVGKSVMTSVVIHNLQEGMAEVEAVVFVYFDYTTNYTGRQLVEALLSQFVQRGMSSSGMKSLQKHMEGARPTFEELWTILEAEVGTFARVFVAIDALDEADGPTWIPLLRRLRTLPGIRILATSRDLGNIAVEFRNDHHLHVMSDEGDLRKYVEGRIAGSTGNFEQMLTKDPSLRAEIVSKVTTKADGMFLLARLHMNALETESRVIDLRRALTKLPQDLKSTYDTTMMRISRKNRPLALRIFSWVIHAARPMSIDDLRYALAVEDGMTVIDTSLLHDQAHLTSVCAGLVILRHEWLPSRRNKQIVVGLVHYTTQRYLRDHISTQLPHPTHLAITCLRYLAFNTPLNRHSQGAPTNAVPLVDYAAKSLGEHARAHREDPTVHHLAMEMLHDHQRVSILGLLACGTEGFSAIHLCAYYGMKDHLIHLLDRGSDVNSKDSDGNTALSVAADCGRKEILQLLLARQGVDVNPKGWRGATPLIRAAMSRHAKIVELLIARNDVDVNLCDNDRRTPIAHAAINGHSEIVGLLLTRSDVNINIQGEDGRTPLALAIHWEYEAIVQLLLVRGDLNIRLKDNDGNTYLTLATHRHNHRIAELLLVKGDIDVNSRNMKGRVALSVAASEGYKTVAKLLLAQGGIDINAIDLSGNTPLDLAETKTPENVFRRNEIEEGRRGIAELLRAAGARRGVDLRTGMEAWFHWLQDH